MLILLIVILANKDKEIVAIVASVLSNLVSGYLGYLVRSIRD